MIDPDKLPIGPEIRLTCGAAVAINIAKDRFRAGVQEAALRINRERPDNNSAADRDAATVLKLNGAILKQLLHLFQV